jgi:hypothetical protein
MNKKLILGTLVVVSLTSANLASADNADENTFSSKIVRAFKSIENFVLGNLGLDPDLDLDLKDSTSKAVVRPETTGALLSGAHVKSDDKNTPPSLLDELFPKNDIDVSTAPQKPFALSTLEKDEATGKLADESGLYPTVEKEVVDATTVSEVPFNVNGTLVVDLGKDNVTEGQVLAEMASSHSDNKNLARLVN